MKFRVRSPEDLGLLLRAARKTAKVRLDDLSHTVQVSKQTTANVEKGKATVQLGTVMRLLDEMGLTLTVDLPESTLPALHRIQEREKRTLPHGQALPQQERAQIEQTLALAKRPPAKRSR